MTRIFVCVDLTAAQAERLADAANPALVELSGAPAEDAGRPEGLNTAEVIFGNPPASWLARAPELKWLQLESVGFGEYANLDWRGIGRGVTVTNLAGFFAEPVAEFILAGILALLRGIPQCVALKDNAVWWGDAIRPNLQTLAGAQVVLFGNGSIARRFEELIAPFGCEINRFGSRWTPRALDAALSSARLVIAAVPHTENTRGVFDGARLKLLAPGAIFANFGRGSLVDEAALADQLETGRLGGAVLDVTRDEPLPPGNRLWHCPNLILTQHSAGGSADEIDRKIDLFLGNLARFRSGQPFCNPVDFARGY